MTKKEFIIAAINEESRFLKETEYISYDRNWLETFSTESGFVSVTPGFQKTVERSTFGHQLEPGEYEIHLIAANDRFDLHPSFVTITIEPKPISKISKAASLDGDWLEGGVGDGFEIVDLELYRKLRGDRSFARDVYSNGTQEFPDWIDLDVRKYTSGQSCELSFGRSDCWWQDPVRGYLGLNEESPVAFIIDLNLVRLPACTEG